jgi:hypothetical protein
MSIAVDSYFPFDTGNGATATLSNWRSMGRRFLSSGIIPSNTNNQFSMSLAGGVATINTGALWIDGFYGEITTPKAVTVGTSSNGLLVARMDYTAKQVLIYWVAGTGYVAPPGVSQRPSQATTGNYDIPLYYINGTTVRDCRQWATSTNDWTGVNLAIDPTNNNYVARARAWRKGNYNLQAGATFPYDTVDYGTGMNVPAGTFTCPYTADYDVTGAFMASATAASDWVVARIFRSGVEIAYGTAAIATAGNQGLTAFVHDIVPCQGGQTLSIVQNTNATSKAISPLQSRCWFTVRALP